MRFAIDLLQDMYYVMKPCNNKVVVKSYLDTKHSSLAQKLYLSDYSLSSRILYMKA